MAQRTNLAASGAPAGSASPGSVCYILTPLSGSHQAGICFPTSLERLGPDKKGRQPKFIKGGMGLALHQGQYIFINFTSDPRLWLWMLSGRVDDTAAADISHCTLKKYS